MVDDYQLDDPVLIALRSARPASDRDDFSADTPRANRILASILERPDVSASEGRTDFRDVPERLVRELLRGSRRSRRRLVFAVALVAAVVSAGVAIAQTVGGFTDWLTGNPGAPASTSQQQAFDRATRSWAGFPQGTQLRLLARTRVAGATYTLYGFRSADALCLRLVITGNQSARQLACPPLSLLRASTDPALVAVADYGVGVSNIRASGLPVPVVTDSTPAALVTVGIVANGVNQVDLESSTGATATAIVSGDAFLSVQHEPAFGEHLRRVWASVANKRVAIPFALPQAPYSWTTTPPLSAHGPDRVQRVVRGGTIDWLTHHHPVGSPLPATVHDVFPRHVPLLFAREIAPDAAAPERMVVGLLKVQKPSPGILVGNQVCEAVVGGRYPGFAGGCWYATQLFSTGPTLTGAATTPVRTTGHVPFNWIVVDQGGGVQYVTVSGLASDSVARLTLFLGTGQQQHVALHDNGYIVEAPSTAYPLRLVAYDRQARVIGVATFTRHSAPPTRTPVGPSLTHPGGS